MITLGIYNPPKRTWKQYLRKIWGVNKEYYGWRESSRFFDPAVQYRQYRYGISI